MQSSQKRRAAKDGETRYNSADATPAWLSKVRGVRKTGEGKEGSHRKCTSEKKKEKGGISKGVLLLPSTHGEIFARKSSEEVNVQNVIFFTSFLFGKNMIQPFFGRSPRLLLLLLLTRAKRFSWKNKRELGRLFLPFFLDCVSVKKCK